MIQNWRTLISVRKYLTILVLRVDGWIGLKLDSLAEHKNFVLHNSVFAIILFKIKISGVDDTN